MSVAASFTRMGRVQAEALMTSSGVVKRATGEKTQDPVTLELVDVYETIYTGKARLRFPDTQPSDAAVPGGVVVKQDAILSLPIEGTGGVRVNDIWVCTGNDLDPGLVGVQVRIAGVHLQSYATARRFPVAMVS